MKIFTTLLAGFLTLAFTTSAIAADDVKKMLVGKWEAVKADEGTLPVGSIVEFMADGKFKVTHAKDGKDQTIEGTYTVDGKKFTYKMKLNDKELSSTITVKKITETELDTTNPEDKSVSFKKVK